MFRAIPAAPRPGPPWGAPGALRVRRGALRGAPSEQFVITRIGILAIPAPVDEGLIFFGKCTLPGVARCSAK